MNPSIHLSLLSLCVLISMSLVACNIIGDDVAAPAQEGKACQTEGERQGQLICKAGQWVFVMVSMDMTPDLTDMSADLVDMTDLDQSTCSPLTDEEICQNQDQFKLQCGPATVTDNCGRVRDVDCGDVCAQGQCNMATNQCECAPAQCPTNAQCGEVTNQCGNTAQCGAGPFCNNNQVCANFQCVDVVFTPSQDESAGAYFGWSVALSGDTVVVGEPGRTLNEVYGVGRVYVFVRDAVSGLWTEQAILEPPTVDHVRSGLFGLSVAIDGDLLAVGMRGASQGVGEDVGAVYVYRRDGTTWSAPTKLQPASLETAELMGHAVAVHGGQVFAGAPGNRRLEGGTIRPNTGAVYYWSCDVASSDCGAAKKLTLPQSKASGNMYFGARLHVAGEHMIVGAPHGPSRDQLGEAFLYKKQADGTWTYQLHIQMADRSNDQEGGSFSHGLAIQWPHIALGQPGHTGVTIDTFTNQRDEPGRVFVEDFTSYATGPDALVELGPMREGASGGLGVVLLRPGSSSGPDGHGLSLAMANNLLAVGAFDSDGPTGQTDAGEVNLWRLQGGAWGHVGKLSAPEIKARAYFGVSVVTDGRLVVVGAPGRYLEQGGNVIARQTGAVHVFEVAP